MNFCRMRSGSCCVHTHPLPLVMLCVQSLSGTTLFCVAVFTDNKQPRHTRPDARGAAQPKHGLSNFSGSPSRKITFIHLTRKQPIHECRANKKQEKLPIKYSSLRKGGLLKTEARARDRFTQCTSRKKISALTQFAGTSSGFCCWMVA